MAERSRGSDVKTMVTEHQEHGEHRWSERPVLSALVGATSFLLPIVLSVAAAVVVSRVLPIPHGAVETVMWWVAVTAATVVALVLVDRVARRLLPLAALLRMSMLFPNRAPSRFRVAFRAGTVRALERRVQYARSRGLEDEPARAAETILTLAAALSAHDRKTRGHSERVRAFTDLLANEMKLTPEDRDRLRWAALLHDVGKLGVSPAILNKQGEPDEDEWAVIHRHPEEGARLVAPLRSWLGPWAASIEHHHEKWDGSGYPFGLSGEEISLGARIVAVADSYEVMTAVRSYKKSLTAADARRELAVCAGSHFDPHVVRAFLNIAIGRLRWAMGPIAWVAELPFVGGLPRAALAPMAQGNTTATAVMGSGIALGLGLAGMVAVDRPAPAVATERPAPAVELAAPAGDADIAVDFDRLVVRRDSVRAEAVSRTVASLGTGAVTPRATATLPVTTTTTRPGGPDGTALVLGESYEAPPATTGAGGNRAPAPGAPTTTTTTTTTTTSPQSQDGDAATATRPDTPVAAGLENAECEATGRGLERGAAEEHPFCPFAGERDD